MATMRKKNINGKVYFYLTKSLRLPGGEVKRIDKLLSKGEPSLGAHALENKYKDYFMRKEGEMMKKLMLSHAKPSHVFSEEEIGKLEGMRASYKYLMRNLTKSQKRDVFDRFTVNFTYNSNAIEGNSLTLKNVRIIIFEHKSVKGKDLREIYETRNSRKVVDMILGRKFGINREDIIKMHKMLMKDIDERTGYKQLPNVILTMGREVKTSMPEDVEHEMEKLIKWYNENISKMHPLEVAAIFHGRFEKIHPFEDGNGRVGRFLLNIILVNNGYPPLIIRNSVRSSYLSALSAFDSGHYDKLERFLLEKFKDTYRKFFEVYVRYV